MKILLALSGGIDSSVVAHLLREQGHELVAVRFTLWSDPLAPAFAQVLPSKCCTTQNAARAKAVATALDIPYRILDLAAEFKTNVVDPYLEAHRNGRTPNPCIGCNRTMKFGKLLEVADAMGCDRIATGHYARLARERLPDGGERTLLLEAVDSAKDQSYYLYGLTQEQLQRIVFPLGAMRKSEVFTLAGRYGIPFERETYRESQDLCFFPEKTPEAFLRRHLAAALVPGSIVRRDGTVLGTHEGLPLYTPGQRRGVGVGGQPIPLEVVEKDLVQNRLIVAPCGDEQHASVRLSVLQWVSWMPQENVDEPFACRTRSLGARLHGHLRFRGTQGTFTFAKPQPPAAPGQSLVLYRGEEIIGGGVVEP
ncbi:MAG: tRNA-specific 2-thiouridylase [Candidatus Peregrinibacteria bacterium Gr01-1014_25]|nr:MAG: tRNA-specific 2-thiouridylase [Candidatus Peregrinibacteria bacterium Gr01-1014_25]